MLNWLKNDILNTLIAIEESIAITTTGDDLGDASVLRGIYESRRRLHWLSRRIVRALDENNEIGQALEFCLPNESDNSVDNA